MSFNPGTLIGEKYVIEKSLGAGGMGAVYLAHDKNNTEFKVALKVLYPGIIRSIESKERFRAEINAAYRVSHENVVRAYEFFDVGGIFAYAMELVEGEDLLTRLQRSSLSVNDTVSLLIQVSDGLQAIHSQGIVHRDMKPENILISPQGIAKIADFGVARLSGGHTLTQDGAMVGTPKYVAPEYVQNGECDYRGDIYALGVIAYECIAGVSPFRSTTKRSLILERFKVRATQLRQVAPQCPEQLIQIIDRAMAVHVASRYQHASELGDDLRNFSNGIEIPLRGRSRLFVLIRWVMIALLSLIFLMVGAYATLSLLPSADSHEKATTEEGEQSSLETISEDSPEFRNFRIKIGVLVRDRDFLTQLLSVAQSENATAQTFLDRKLNPFLKKYDNGDPIPLQEFSSISREVDILLLEMEELKNQ